MSTKFIDPWAAGLLADPITKKTKKVYDFMISKGVLDARVYLPNSPGFADWAHGQSVYEEKEISGERYKSLVENYKKEINYDREIYERFKLVDPIVDIGGGVGTVREFFPDIKKYISVDPFLEAPFTIPKARKEAYKSLERPLNFVAGMAEFLPLQTEKFETVHMRSMLDHVQVPDLALLEANRVLVKGGRLILGLAIDGRPFGQTETAWYLFKAAPYKLLGKAGVKKFRDHHVWHPTLNALTNLVLSSKFSILEVFWQTYWEGKVVYIYAEK